MGNRIALCRTDEMASGEARRFDLADGSRIALVRIGNDFYAVGDECSHADYSLSDGDVYVEECAIECWKHGSTFSLVTGEAQCLPATKPVPTYPVEIDGDQVMVVLP